METIQILGPGCPKCNETAELVKAAAKEAGVAVEVNKVTDFQEMAKRGVFSTPAVVIDGAHTPRSVQIVLDTFTRLFGTEGVLLFAAATGKKIPEMAQILAPAFRRIVVTTPGTFRESNAEEVHRAFLRHNPGTLLIPDSARALARARELAGAERPLLVTGSFYLAGLIREILYL